MLNLLLQSHPFFIPMESLVILWDFGLRPPARRDHRGLRPGGILDLWNRYALSIKNRQNSLNLKSKIQNLKLLSTSRGTKMGLINLSKNKQFSSPQVQSEPYKNRTVQGC